MRLILFKNRYFWSLFFLVVAGIWFRFGILEFRKLPSDFVQKSEINSFDNFYDKERSLYTGEQQSATNFLYRVTKSTGKVLEIENLFEVSTLDGNPIFSVTRFYTIDPYTKKHIESDGQKKREGFLFGPIMKGFLKDLPDKSSFHYWHVNYDSPAYMVFSGTENIFGLETYRYEANFVADQTEEQKGKMESVGVDKGITLDVNLSVWVEPYTGRIVKYEDATEAFYYDLATGNRLYPWNKFHNSMSTSSVYDQVKLTNILKEKYIILEYAVTGVLVFFGLISLFLPFLRTRSDLFLSISFGVFILAFSLVGSLVFYKVSTQQRLATFDAETARVSALISNRLDLVSNALRGGKGLFDASDSVSREEWKIYISSLNLSKNYPGIQGVGFAKNVFDKDKSEFEKSVADEVFGGFTIVPNEKLDRYTPVMFLEPFDARNKKAFGFNLTSEEVRKKAIDFARDSGETGLSGKITLVQENLDAPQSGFLIMAPIYKPNTAYLNPVERRENIFGYSYAPLRMNDFMIGLLSGQSTKIGVEIFDGNQSSVVDEENLMYRNEFVDTGSYFSKTIVLNLFNHSWTIRYSAGKNFAYDALRDLAPIIILVLGVVFSVLMSSLLYVLRTSRKKALDYADLVTKDLKELNASLEMTKQEALNRAMEAEKLNKITVNRELKMIALKDEIENLKRRIKR